MRESGLKGERICLCDHVFIPPPQPIDIAGPLDTRGEDYEEVTFTPNILDCPFPAKFLNQFEKLARVGKAARGL